MNSFDLQNNCDENFDLSPAQLEELMRESAEIQDAQGISWEGIFPEDHTDETYDAWRESQIHDGIWN